MICARYGAGLQREYLLKLTHEKTSLAEISPDTQYMQGKTHRTMVLRVYCFLVLNLNHMFASPFITPPAILTPSVRKMVILTISRLVVIALNTPEFTSSGTWSRQRSFPDPEQVSLIFFQHIPIFKLSFLVIIIVASDHISSNISERCYNFLNFPTFIPPTR